MTSKPDTLIWNSLQEIANELTFRSTQTKEGKTKWVHTAVHRILGRAA